jgi:hypothetical protein
MAPVLTRPLFPAASIIGLKIFTIFQSIEIIVLNMNETKKHLLEMQVHEIL